jgi:hypothetical protein
MPTKRKRVSRLHQVTEVSPALWHYLRTGDYAGGPGCLDLFFMDERAFGDAWQAVRDSLLGEWIPERPGTRPWAWWQFEAPEARRRLGGTGNRWADVHGDDRKQRFLFGLPTDWLSQSLVDYYNGRGLVQKDRNCWNLDYKEGAFPFVGVDANDPPRFESEAAYLQRHGVLTKPELKLPQSAFEPEVMRFEA